MPSPFPGMDPFIEHQAWEDFHVEMITALRAALNPAVRPRYVVRVEERIYLEHHPESQPPYIRPDLSVLEPAGGERPSRSGAAVAEAVSIAPVMLTLPIPEEERQVFLMVRERETMEVVTVIELLSPNNKRAGSDGRREYLEKREAVLLSRAHLVELDLLRRGERLPTVEPLPAGDYYSFVSRQTRRPAVEVRAWSLRSRLPTLPIPLAGSDPDAELDLQAVFNAAYDRAGYDYSLDYRRPVEPPLGEADAAWAREQVEQRSP